MASHSSKSFAGSGRWWRWGGVGAVGLGRAWPLGLALGLALGAGVYGADGQKVAPGGPAAPPGATPPLPVAPAAQPAPATRPVLGPARVLAPAVPGATTRRATTAPSPAPSAARPLNPKKALRLSTRPARVPPSRAGELAAAPERPPMASMRDLPLPAPVTFATGPRYTPAPSPQLSLRLPNLLTSGSSKRSLPVSTNPAFTPASPVNTSPVTNVDGRASLAKLPPLTRELAIDPVPLPAPLPFDQSPYLAAPGAPDDRDAPARTDTVPGRAPLDEVRSGD